MLAYCFGETFEFRLNRVEALTYIAHVASIGLLVKLGFQEEGIRREYGFWKNEFHDLRSFSLLRREWQGELRARVLPVAGPACSAIARPSNQKQVLPPRTAFEPARVDCLICHIRRRLMHAERFLSSKAAHAEGPIARSWLIAWPPAHRRPARRRELQPARDEHQACDGCDACHATDHSDCVIGDDMDILYPKLRDADAIVVASPIYWFTMSAQAKLCIDRWYALETSQGSALRGKQFAFVLSYATATRGHRGKQCHAHLSGHVRYLKAEIVGMVYGQAGDEGDIEKQPKLLEKAFKLGRS